MAVVMEIGSIVLALPASHQYENVGESEWGHHSISLPTICYNMPSPCRYVVMGIWGWQTMSPPRGPEESI